MVFSSPFFLWVFLPLVLLAWALVRWAPRSVGHATLTLASLVFYGWSNPAFVPLLLLSMVVDFGCGWWIARNQPGASASPGQLPLCPPGGERVRAQRLGVAASVIVNLGVLAFFKYANFGLDSWNAAVVTLGAEELAVDEFLRVALPLGISFYTFQSMSYTIDVYCGPRVRDGALRSWILACYVSMFPQLVAGPIVRYSGRRRSSSTERQAQDLSRMVSDGVALLIIGRAWPRRCWWPTPSHPLRKVAGFCHGGAGAVGVVDACDGGARVRVPDLLRLLRLLGHGHRPGAASSASVFPENFDFPYIAAAR